MLAAAQERERLTFAADAASKLHDDNRILEGGVALGALGELEAKLSGSSFDCTEAPDQIGAAVKGLNSTGSLGAVAVSENFTVAPEGAHQDQDRILSPFNGSRAGDLGIEIVTKSMGSYPSVGVHLLNEERHFASIPVRVSSLIRFCLSAVSSMRLFLSGVEVTDCTLKEVGRASAPETDVLRSQALAIGFEYSFHFRMLSQQPCLVSYLTSVSQQSVPGPTGPFSFEASERGTVLVSSTSTVPG